MHRRCCWPPDSDSAEVDEAILHLIPQRRIAQRLFDFFLDADLRAHATDAQPVGDVLEDRLRKGIGLLEHHADAHAHFDRIDVARHQIDVLGQQPDAALVAGARRQVVHAVEAAQECGLAAAGGTDQRRDLLLADIHGEALERLELAHSRNPAPRPGPSAAP